MVKIFYWECEDMTFMGLIIVFGIVILMVIEGLLCKKKWLRIVSMLLLAFIIIFGYSIFKGIPFGNYIAKAKIASYVKQVYGINKKLKMPQYNFKDSYYLVDISDGSYKFEISYDLLNNTIRDEKVNSAYNSLFQEKYQELSKSYNGNIKLPLADSYTLISANGKYSKNIYDLKCFQMVYILGIVSSEKISPGGSIKMPAKVTKNLLDKLGEQFNVTSLQVIYTDLNGCFQVIVRGKDKVTLEKMQKNTSRTGEIGEVEQGIILELNK